MEAAFILVGSLVIISFLIGFFKSRNYEKCVNAGTDRIANSNLTPYNLQEVNTKKKQE